MDANWGSLAPKDTPIKVIDVKALNEPASQVFCFC